jgi:hypothetical protein
MPKVSVGFIFLFLVLGIQPVQLHAETHNFKVLIKVADFPIVDSDRDLEFFLRNPTRFKGSVKTGASEAQLEEVLNRLVVETMIFEENKVVGNVELGAADGLALLKTIKSGFGTHWREFLLLFDQDENSIKERLIRRSLVDKVIQKKIEAVLKLPNSSKESADSVAQKSVEDWLKQLRGRYRIQVFE